MLGSLNFSLPPLASQGPAAPLSIYRTLLLPAQGLKVSADSPCAKPGCLEVGTGKRRSIGHGERSQHVCDGDVSSLSFLEAMAVWPFSGGRTIALGPPCRNP